MQCNICPLFSSWNNESDSGEACALFGDGWDSQFMYERNNQIWGCYIEKAYIKKVEQRIEKYREEAVKAFLEAEREREGMKNCTDCILDGTDACQRGAGRAVDDEVCECFVDDKETEVDFSRMFEESEGEDDNS